MRKTSCAPSRELPAFLTRVTAAALAIAVLAPACGDSGTATTAPAATVTAPEDSQPTTSSPEPAGSELAPADLGDMIFDIYLEAIGEVVAVLADRPDGPTATSVLQDLKESYIRRLVELGRLREAMDETDRSAVDARLLSSIGSVPADLFEEFQLVVADYQAIDPDVANLISSFNIITQYAAFDLLRSQEPDEAARVLGD